MINFYNIIINQFYNNKDIKLRFYNYIRIFKFDNAGEFKLNKWTYYYKSKGIIYKYINLYSLSQNDIIERLNKYIIERLISVYKAKKIPFFLWL